MGLLDDAIREHLELKRLRGADPGLVAREEREAFGPVRGGDPADGDGDVVAHDDGLADEDVQLDGGDFGQAYQAGEAQALSNVGQETAELDMRSVLGEESDHDGESADGRQGEPVDDVLEGTPDFPRETPEQERLWFEQHPPRDFDFDK